MKPFHNSNRPLAISLILAVILSVALAGCKIFGGSRGSSSDSSGTLSSSVVLGTLIASPAMSPVTVFNQTIARADGNWSPFPGQANYWDINSDFSLSDGGDDQFDGALNLTVGATSFPYDQDYSELTYYGPTVGIADGLVVAAVTDGSDGNTSVISGVYSAALGSVSDAKLQQTLNLAAATGTVTLTWSNAGNFNSGSMANEPASTFQVVLRDTNGNLLSTLYDNLGTGTYGTADLTAYAGQTVVLSFERFGSVHGNYVAIDDVSVTDGAATQFVVNGDFESGDLTSWATNDPQEIQNVTSGVRSLEGLDVKRSFYTVPDKEWGRWVDVFENNTGSPITKTVTYTTNLGSDGAGIIYSSPNTGNKALSSWDGDTGDRDVGIVIGNATTVTFLSDDDFGNYNGDDYIYNTFDITVPAGGRVAIVHFIVMNGTDTYNTATSVSDLATDVDTQVKNIVDNFWVDSQYRNGMTQAQIDAIVNF